MNQLCLFLLIILIIPRLSFAQDSLILKKYYSSIERTSKKYEEQINKRSTQVLNLLSKQERKMQRKLVKIDSVAAKKIFIGGFKNDITSSIPATGYLDTLQNTLTFLHAANALKNVQRLQGQLQQAEQIQAYIRERKEQLKQQLAQYTGFTKNLQQINKEAYYYGEQLKEYKSLYQDPKKAEARAMSMLQKLPAYNDFIKRNSQLAGLFNLAGNYNTTRSLEGLQTRTQVASLVTQQIGTSPDAGQVISQQMEQARSKFNDLKSKYPALNSAADMPDFKPREMKTKTFFQRLAPGGNIQFQKSNQYFPTTADIAAQLAYKFSKDGSVGAGLSYKLGIGTGWNHIAFSHLGLGLRSFADYKLRGTFFINGGFEFNRISDFKWTKSALAGISKKYKINNKLKGNIMLLYDFLAPQQLPKTDNFKLRLGYTL